MHLQYVENPKITVDEVAALRIAVAWDSRKEKLEKTIGSTYLTVACFNGNNLVGFVDVISDGVDDAFIRNLVVHPDYQKHGIALRMLRMAAERIKKDKIKTANVLFEPELTDLYRRAGFRIVSGGMIDNEVEEL